MNEPVKPRPVSIGFRKDLYRCPFCGGAAVAEYENGVYFFNGFVIRCSDCEIRTPVKTYNCGALRSDGWHKITEIEALEQAVISWNRRATV